MTTNIHIVDGLTQRCDEYSAKAVLLRKELNEIEDLERACRLLLADIKRNAKSGDGGQGLHAHVRPSHLAHCTTQMQAWVEIACRSGGFARPSDGAQLIVDAGLSTSKRRSVVSSGAKCMIDSDEWERTSAGTYRYLGHVGDEDPGPDGSKEEQQWPAESYPTGDGDASPRTCPANEATVVALGRITA